VNEIVVRDMRDYIEKVTRKQSSNRIGMIARCLVALVFTLTGYFNYGNRLLCAATRKIFASFGVDAEIMIVEDEIANLPFPAKLKRKIKKALRYRLDKMLVKTCLFLVKRVGKELDNRKHAEIYRLREERFRDFSAEHITEKSYGLSTTHFPPSFPDKFDFSW
jgi:hypothetical protein